MIVESKHDKPFCDITMNELLDVLEESEDGCVVFTVLRSEDGFPVATVALAIAPLAGRLERLMQAGSGMYVEDEAEGTPAGVIRLVKGDDDGTADEG